VQQIQVALQRRHAVALLQRDQRFSSGTGAGGDNMIFMIKNRLIFPYVSTHTHTHTHTHIHPLLRVRVKIMGLIIIRTD
jgi:hypothetical protein